MRRIDELMARQNTLLAKIEALKTYRRREGTCDEVRLRRLSAESVEVAAQIQAETRRWDAAHPHPGRRGRPAAARSSPHPARQPAPARRLTRGEFQEAAARLLEGESERMPYGLVRDLALRDIEARNLAPHAADRLDGLVRTRDAGCDGKLVARYIVLTGSAGYEELFRTMLSQSTPALSPRAVDAWTDYQDLMRAIGQRAFADEGRRFASGEIRAMNEGTGSAGGFGVPYYLDPTVVPTSGLDQAQILSVAQVRLTTVNYWRGVTASTSGFATRAEAAAAAEDDPTFAQPGGGTIPLYEGTDWLPFSIELGMDQPDWATHASELFASAYNSYLSTKTAVGSGSNDPTGIFTAMTNTTTSPAHVAVTTAGTVGAVDLRAAWAALPERYRVDRSCAWMMSPSVEQKVSVLAAESQTNGLGPQDYITDPATGQRRLFGRPVIVADACPTFTGTTGSENFCVVGAFSRFVVAQRLGSFVMELVPLVPDFNNGGRPSGNRGFMATVRLGCGPVNADAFRLLSNS